jgi:O-Antigen ligase
VLITSLLVALLLYAAFLVAPDTVRMPILVLAALMVVVVAFSSVELTLYLLILSTLLSPQLRFGGATAAQIAAEHLSTTTSRGITLRVDDLLLILISLTWLFRMAVFKDLGTVRKTPINKPIGWYWLATAFATLGGFYAGRVGMYGFFFVAKYLEYFVLFYMIVNQIHDEQSIRRYIKVMLFTCLVASLIGIAQIPSGVRVSAPFEGTEGEPNTFGGYLVLMFSVVLGIFLHVQDQSRRIRLVLLGCTILVPLAFTESRSSYLAFVAAIGLFILFARQKRLLIIACLIGLILMPVVMPQNVIQRVMYTFDQAHESGQIKVGGYRIDTSTSERLHSWERVLEHDFPRHPLLGVGVTGGEFMDAQYPRVLSETGLIGLALFLWFLRRVWVLLRQSYDRLQDPVIKGAALGTLCGYGGLLFHAIGTNTFIIVRIMEPFMILLGLLMAAMLVEKDEVQASEPLATPETPGLQTAGTG